MGGLGYPEILFWFVAAFYCVIPLSTIVLAVLWLRQKKRADVLEAALRQAGWNVHPPSSWAAGTPTVTPPGTDDPPRR